MFVTEEEVDVVTVEKNASTSTTQSTPVGVICDNGKLLSTLLQKNNGAQPQLKLVTTGTNRLESTITNQQNRIRSNKTKSTPAMSMVITSSSGTKTLNLQLKCVPVINSNSTQAGMKRKVNSSGDQETNAVVHLMKLTPTSPKSIVSDVKEEEEVIGGGKRRFLSLEGISMVSNTGINRVRNEVTPTIKSEINSSPTTSFPMQTLKNERLSSVASTERKKAARKYTKKTTSAPYETPTSSPESSSGDSPSSPSRRKISGGRFSGSEEGSIRAAHNVLERQRREGLRNLYGELRVLVPQLADLEKAPKVTILTKAKEYVDELKQNSMKLKTLKRLELEKQEVLKGHIREMAAELASVGSSPIRNSFYMEPEYPASNYAVFVN